MMVNTQEALKIRRLRESHKLNLVASSYVRSARLNYEEAIEMASVWCPSLVTTRQGQKILLKVKRIDIDWLCAVIYLLSWADGR